MKTLFLYEVSCNNKGKMLSILRIIWRNADTDNILTKPEQPADKGEGDDP